MSTIDTLISKADNFALRAFVEWCVAYGGELVSGIDSQIVKFVAGALPLYAGELYRTSDSDADEVVK